MSLGHKLALGASACIALGGGALAFGLSATEEAHSMDRSVVYSSFNQAQEPAPLNGTYEDIMLASGTEFTLGLYVVAILASSPNRKKDDSS